MKYIVTLLLLISGIASAQSRLTLQESIARVLKHNFDINIAVLSTEQAVRNNTLGNAGFSPSVLFRTNLSGSRNNVQSMLSNGNTQNNPSAKSSNFNPFIDVNWTVFDGGRMFIVKKQLNELEAQAQESYKFQVQLAVSRTIQMYAQIIWQRQQAIAVDTALKLARVRMYITQMKYEMGAGAKIDYLQARVDYNSRRADSLTQISSINTAVDSLNVLMGEDDYTPYIFDDSMELNTQLQPMDKERLRDVNPALSLFRYNARVSHLNADIAKTYMLPSVTLDGTLSYSKTTNTTGFSSFNKSYGGTGLVSLNMPIFEGGNLRRQAKVASLQAMKDDLLYERQNTVLGRQYRTSWINYQISVASYFLELESIKYAQENLNVQLARFKVGMGTTLEARQAENDYVIALERLYTAEYNLKVNETKVLELEDRLVTHAD